MGDPGFSGCFSCTWEPFVVTSNHPSCFSVLRTSRLSTTYIIHTDTHAPNRATVSCWKHEAKTLQSVTNGERRIAPSTRFVAGLPVRSKLAAR